MFNRNNEDEVKAINRCVNQIDSHSDDIVVLFDGLKALKKTVDESAKEKDAIELKRQINEMQSNLDSTNSLIEKIRLKLNEIIPALQADAATARKMAEECQKTLQKYNEIVDKQDRLFDEVKTLALAMINEMKIVLSVKQLPKPMEINNVSEPEQKQIIEPQPESKPIEQPVATVPTEKPDNQETDSDDNEDEDYDDEEDDETGDEDDDDE